MKKINTFYLVIFVILCILSKASTQDTIHYLFKNGKPHTFGIYYAPQFSLANIEKSNSTFGNGALMAILNNRWAFGFYSQFITTEHYKNATFPELNFNQQTGGLKFEYTFFPQSAVHLTLPLEIGVTKFTADSLKENDYKFDDNFHHHNKRNANQYEKNNLVIAPGLNIELNIIKCLKLYAGASYNLYTDISNANNDSFLDDKYLPALQLNAGAKIGFFNIKKCTHHKHSKFRPFGRPHKRLDYDFD